MALTRKALANLGLSKDIIERVMALHGISMAKAISKSGTQTTSLNVVREIHGDSLISSFQKNNGKILTCRKINYSCKTGACRYTNRHFISGSHLNQSNRRKKQSLRLGIVFDMKGV